MKRIKQSLPVLIVIAIVAAFVCANVFIAYSIGDNPTAGITYSDDDGTFCGSQEVTITATFSEEMTTTPPPKIAISGAETVAETTMTQSDATTWYYNYTVAGTEDGTCTVALSNGEDLEGESLESTPTSGASFYIDVTAPTASIAYSDSTVNIGEEMTITATFNEDMADSPAPKIAISGGNTLSAATMTKTDATHYYYVHTVADGEGACTVALSVGTDEAGNVITAAPTSGATFYIRQVSGDYTAAAAGAVGLALLIGVGAVARKRRTP